ncbi:MAG: hypothetical protein LAP40_09370 [Acidobacteriia bacterium]|nr:hypothetical protein [Terriglobia bacterium]
MLPVRSSAAALAGMWALAAPLLAQWPSYPAAGVPRTPDGKIKMDAPAPKAADGHPDLSGIWETRGPALGRGGRAGRGGTPGPPSGPPPPPPPPVSAEGIPLATFRNIGAGFKDGLPIQPWAADLLKQRKAQNGKDNPDAHCLPLGLMQLHEHPQPRKIIQTPGVIVILYEAQAGVRQIFTDGRPLPNNDPQPWWYGYSVGKWEGDTLVVETNGFRDDVWLDIDGSPLTNAGRMIERFRRTNFGSLEIQVTIDDPKVYTKPFTVQVNQRLMPDTELIEFICQENDRSGPHLVGK